MKIVNITFAAAAILTAVLFLQSITLTRQNQALASKLDQAGRVVAAGKNDLTALRALASRVNESAASDKDLKAALDRVGINITANVAASAANKPIR